MSATDDRSSHDICRIGFVVVFFVTAAAGAGVGPLVSGVGSVSAQTDDAAGNATIENVTMEGEGFNESQYDMIADHPGPPYVWQDRELRLNVTVESRGDSGTFTVCGRAISDADENDGSSVSFDCEEFRMSEGDTQTVSIAIGSWPENATGKYTIIAVLSDSGLDGETTIDDSALAVSVIERDGDLTGDGLTNGEEFEHGTDITRPDTDGDGLTDWQEVKKYGTDPLASDTTGDGVSDGRLGQLGVDPTVPYVLHRYLAGGLLALVVLVGGSVSLMRRRGDGTATVSDRFTAPWEDRPEGDNGESGEHGENRENGEGPIADEEPPIDESILTNREVVCRLLERNNGRMRQGHIVDSTEWSKAKVSRVLSELEDDGVVRRVRIGRENVVDLETDGIDAAEPDGD